MKDSNPEVSLREVTYTSCVPGAGGPGPFYEKTGFVYTGAARASQRATRNAGGDRVPGTELVALKGRAESIRMLV